MSANELHRSDRATWIVSAMFSLFGLGVSILCVVAYIHGSDDQVKAALAEAVVVENENSSLCRALGLVLQTEGYMRCINGLAEIRRRHDDRRNEGALGIL